MLCACETIATKEGKFFCVVRSRLKSHDELQIGSKDKLTFTLYHLLSPFLKEVNFSFSTFNQFFTRFSKKRKVDVLNHSTANLLKTEKQETSVISP